MKTREELRDEVRKGAPPRHLLLAYAFIRSKPYRDIELHTRTDNRPSPSAIAEIADAPVELIKLWLDIAPTRYALARYRFGQAKGVIRKVKNRRRIERSKARLAWLMKKDAEAMASSSDLPPKVALP